MMGSPTQMFMGDTVAGQGSVALIVTAPFAEPFRVATPDELIDAIPLLLEVQFADIPIVLEIEYVDE